MNIFDSKTRNSWSGNGAEFIGSNILMSERCTLESPIPPIVHHTKMKIIVKKRSGNGKLGVRILLPDKSILFDEEFEASSSSWAEKIFNILPDFDHASICKIQLYRPKGSIGRVELARVCINSDIPAEAKKEKAKDSTIDYIIKNYCDFSIKLAIVVPYGIYGGAEVYIKSVLNKIDAKFIKTDILYLHENKLSSEVSLKNTNHIKINGAGSLRARLITNDYDVIVYYNSLNVYNIINDISESGHITSKILEIYHSDFSWSDSISKINHRECTDKIIKVSNSILNNFEYENTDVTKIPVGIDLKKFRKRELENLKETFLKRPGSNLFGTVARLSKEKNLFYFVDIASRMPKDQFVIAGSGPLESELKMYCMKKEINNVSFLGQRSDVENLYSIFDAFILTSSMEGTPISILESMACECPVFTTNVGAISDVITDNYNGFFLAGNLDEDVDKIRGNLNNKQIIKNAKRYIKDNHNISETSKMFLEEIIFEPRFYSRISEESSNVLDVGSYI